MFSRRYFGKAYFPNRYWPDPGSVVIIPVPDRDYDKAYLVTFSSGRIRFQQTGLVGAYFMKRSENEVMFEEIVNDKGRISALIQKSSIFRVNRDVAGSVRIGFYADGSFEKPGEKSSVKRRISKDLDFSESNGVRGDVVTRNDAQVER